jgi:hypothetical protein
MDARRHATASGFVMADRITGTAYLLGLWRRIRRRRALGRVARVVNMNDVPKRFGGQIFIVGERNAKWVVLECPCRCGDRIDVNLMTSRKPHWTLAVSERGVTLSPSLWVPKEKCGSHFFVRNNRVVWIG